ncbi:MAG: hypothetical protein WKF92_11395 [Pyrinomonadaceae bacterium]
MSEQSGKDQAVPDMEDGAEHTTPSMPAAPAAPAQWSMPEPVFQQTSGYLPQGYLKQIEDSGGDAPNGDVLDIPAIASNTTIAPLGQPPAEPILEMEAAPAAAPQEIPDAAPAEAFQEIPDSAPAPAVNIEPQPYLSESNIESLPAAAPAVTPAKSSGLRTVLIALALLGMLALLIVFLAFIYAYFIAGTGNSTTF